MGMKLEKPDGSVDERYSIGKYDPHPNKLGHEKIAKEIHESFWSIRKTPSCKKV